MLAERRAVKEKGTSALPDEWTMCCTVGHCTRRCVFVSMPHHGKELLADRFVARKASWPDDDEFRARQCDYWLTRVWPPPPAKKRALPATSDRPAR